MTLFDVYVTVPVSGTTSDHYRIEAESEDQLRALIDEDLWAVTSTAEFVDQEIDVDADDRQGPPTVDSIEEA